MSRRTSVKDADVFDLRDVGEATALAGQRRGGHELEGGVLGAADGHGAAQPAAALDAEDLPRDGFGLELPVERSGVRHPLLARGRAPGPPADGAERLSCSAPRIGGSLRDLETDDRPLQRRASGDEVGGLDHAAFDDALGLATGPFRPLDVDLGGHVGGLGQDDDAVRADLDEAAEDGELLLVRTPRLSRRTPWPRSEISGA